MYLEPNREMLTAYARQVMRLDERAWRARVEAVRPEHYSQIRELVEREDLPALVGAALERCATVAGEVPAPDVALLVGFFSPDAFIFRVRERLCIGIGLERWRDFGLLLVLIAHEYGHYLRRRALGDSDSTLAEAIAAEGVAIAFSQRAYPEHPLHRHLRTSPERLRWWREHVSLLWAKVRPHLRVAGPDVVRRFLTGDPEGPLSRCGEYLGYAAVVAYARAAGLEVVDDSVITAPPCVLIPAADKSDRAMG